MSTETILIIEDEEDIANLIAHNVREAGFQVMIARNGTTAFKKMESQLPDLIVLDLVLPDMDGTEICKMLKRKDRSRQIPVIMVTAKGEEVDRIVGLELGADDYIVKPFSTRELVLRIKNVLHRAKGPKEETKVLTHGNVSLDVDAHKVTISGEKIDLTLTEFKLLHELLANKGRVRSREILLNNVWGYTFEGYERTVDTHVQRLRRKMKEDGGVIETVRGVGYMIRESAL